MDLDKLFYEEFKELTRFKYAKLPENQRRLSVIPIPNLFDPALGFNCSQMKGRQVLIHGIEEQGSLIGKGYDQLNGKYCAYLPKAKLRRKKFNKQGYIKDDKGNFVYDDIALPRGSVAIVTDTQVMVKLDYREGEGFKYIDTIRKGTQVFYKYVVPRKYCYEVNRCALVLSGTQLKAIYTGYKIVLTNGLTVYLCVIPYKPNRQDTAYKVLAMKASYNFRDEIHYIVKQWQRVGVMYPVDLTQLSKPINGVYNTALVQLTSALAYEDYVRYDAERSLADTGEDIDEL